MNLEKTIPCIAESELPYAHWLYNIPGVGRKTIAHLLAQIDSPKTIFTLSEKEILPFLTEQQKNRGLAERLMKSKQNRNIHEEYDKLTKKHIHFTCQGHSAYPRRLSDIPDAPYGLYYRGRLPDQNKPSAAVIGARNCSEYGRRMAECFGRELAAAGVQIISGMARGIDGIGQREALLAGGYSLGVMGCGVDICYPSENRELFDMLCRNGGVCSEYPPGTQPKNSLFPPRNRIISALSDLVLVIEAKNRSGTLITVDMALEQGKEVYALPGRVTDALSEGCNRLIQQGAGIAVSPETLVSVLADVPSGSGVVREKIRENTDGFGRGCSAHSLLSDVQLSILEVLDDSPRSVENIKEQLLSKGTCDMSFPELMDQLIRLSLCGAARQISNSYFVKG